MYDTLKKCDRLKDKWNRKVQILSKKQHSVTDLGLTLKQLFISSNFIRTYLSTKHLEKNTVYSYIIQIKRLYQKGFSASMTFL